MILIFKILGLDKHCKERNKWTRTNLFASCKGFVNLLVVVSIKWLWRHLMGTANIIFVLFYHLSGNSSVLCVSQWLTE